MTEKRDGVLVLMIFVDLTVTSVTDCDSQSSQEFFKKYFDEHYEQIIKETAAEVLFKAMSLVKQMVVILERKLAELAWTVRSRHSFDLWMTHGRYSMCLKFRSSYGMPVYGPQYPTHMLSSVRGLR